MPRVCEEDMTKIKRNNMFPLGALFGLVGQGISGALSVVNNRRAQQEADVEAARQNAFYQAKANENPLSRSEVKYILGQYDRSAKQQIENARGVAAIKGATPEFTAAIQKGVAEGRANLMGKASADASQRADYYTMMGENARHQKAQEDMKRRLARNSTYAALAGNAASAVGAIMDGYSAGKVPESAPSNIDGGSVEIGQSTSEKIANSPSRAAQLQVGASATTSPIEKKIITDTANAAANAQKIAASTPPINTLQPGSAAKVTDGGYIQNADGTYIKDGVRYYRNFDGSFARV